MERVFITGSAGFIGFHLARALLEEGVEVTGYDGLTDYYDVELKRRRLAALSEYPRFRVHEAMLEDGERLRAAVEEARPQIIVHLAAQAGVRYSLEHPRSYIESNLLGTFNLLEAAREGGLRHLLMASTSSAYGANTQMPFSEQQACAHPLSLYAATKISNEAMAHAYAHLWSIPTTMLRFFTVYGPWGRPDMALFKFARGIFEGAPIEVYNHGKMQRDFTFIDDLVLALRRLFDAAPPAPQSRGAISPVDTLSPAAPFRVVNIGRGKPEALEDFIAAIERASGRKAHKTYLEMQKGDVPATWADTRLLKELVGEAPQTPIEQGVARFIAWYREYYGV